MTIMSKLTGDDLEQALQTRNLPSEGTADDKRAAVEQHDQALAGANGETSNPPGSTTLDSDLTTPQTTAPGDAPADTTDPTERATSATPDKAAAAQAGFGSVNAVVPLPTPEKVDVPKVDDRIEEYDTVGPNGKVVHVTHNIDTGETAVS